MSKTYPASDVRLLAELGVTDVGENRDQEASAKARECADLDLTWHFVGQLQTNKARSVVGYADVVHSVDRPRLVAALSQEARQGGQGDHLPGAGRPGRRPRAGRRAAGGRAAPWRRPSPAPRGSGWAG